MAAVQLLAPLAQQFPYACGVVPPPSPAALRDLLLVECTVGTVQSLEPYIGFLLNLNDALSRSPSEAASFHAFLRFIDCLHVNESKARIALAQSNRRCQELEWHLRQALEGRAGDGFRSAIQRGEVTMTLQAERQQRASDFQVRSALIAQVQALEAKLEHGLDAQRQQMAAMEAQSQSFTQAMHKADADLALEKQRQARLNSEHCHVVAGLNEEIKGLTHALTDMRAAEESTRARLQEETGWVIDLQKRLAQSDEALDPWRTLQSIRVSPFVDVVEFYRKRPPKVVGGATHQQLMLPVFCLEWLPGFELDLNPRWQTACASGAFGLLGRLCSGELVPQDEELYISVCHVDGRWLGAVGGDMEAHRLVALFAFQALRLDVTVHATCRLVAPQFPMNFDQKQRSTPAIGKDRRVAPAPLTPGPTSVESTLRALLRGCPLERQLLTVLKGVHGAH